MSRRRPTSLCATCIHGEWKLLRSAPKKGRSSLPDGVWPVVEIDVSFQDSRVGIVPAPVLTADLVVTDGIQVPDSPSSAMPPLGGLRQLVSQASRKATGAVPAYAPGWDQGQ